MSFAAATAVRPLSGGGYEVELDPAYAIAGERPNGGYVFACLARAALHAAHEAGATQQHIVGGSVSFFSSPALGTATIATDVLRVGRTATQVIASLDGVHARFTLGNLHESSVPFWGAVAPVELAPIEQCHPSPTSFARGVTVAFDPATSFTMTPDGPIVTGEGEFRAWFTDEHSEAVDTVELMFASDALPPATFGIVQTGWVPTLDLTVYVRAIPAPGPLRMRFRAQVIQDGYVDEICEAWDSEGRLVMQSTQLAAMRLPAA